MALLPLFLVFISGFGFSVQTLFIKLLVESGFHSSFQCVFFRGLFQMLISIMIMSCNRHLNHPIFGDTNKISFILLLRAIVGYGGIAFAFLAVEKLPVGDATVLTMLSPFVAGIAAIFILKEAWKYPDFIATLIALVGMIFVAKPSFLFGDSASSISIDATDGSASNHSNGNANHTSTTAWSSTTVGVTFALLSSLFAGGAYILVRMLGVMQVPWENVCFSQGIGQVILSIPSLYAAQQTLRFDLSLLQVLLVVLVGVIGSFSQVAMTVGMQREKSATATAMRMSDVVFSYLMEFLFTQDKLNSLSIFGSCLVSFSILIIVYFKRQTDNQEKKNQQQQVQIILMDATTTRITKDGLSSESELKSSNMNNDQTEITITEDDDDNDNDNDSKMSLGDTTVSGNNNNSNSALDNSKAKKKNSSIINTIFRHSRNDHNRNRTQDMYDKLEFEDDDDDDDANNR